MINPVAPAANFFLAFFNNMPTALKSFVFLCVGLWLVSVFVHLIYR